MAPETVPRPHDVGRQFGVGAQRRLPVGLTGRRARHPQLLADVHEGEIDAGVRALQHGVGDPESIGDAGGRVTGDDFVAAGRSGRRRRAANLRGVAGARDEQRLADVEQIGVHVGVQLGQQRLAHTGSHRQTAEGVSRDDRVQLHVLIAHAWPAAHGLPARCGQRLPDRGLRGWRGRRRGPVVDGGVVARRIDDDQHPPGDQVVRRVARVQVQDRRGRREVRLRELRQRVARLDQMRQPHAPARDRRAGRSDGRRRRRGRRGLIGIVAGAGNGQFGARPNQMRGRDVGVGVEDRGLSRAEPLGDRREGVARLHDVDIGMNRAGQRQRHQRHDEDGDDRSRGEEHSLECHSWPAGSPHPDGAEAAPLYEATPRIAKRIRLVRSCPRRSGAPASGGSGNTREPHTVEAH